MKPNPLTVMRPFVLVLSIIVLTVCFFSVTGMAAKPDYIFFSVNGDTTGATLTQADLFAWGSNCDSGASINWEIWYDANSNSVIDPGTDAILTSETVTDGDPMSEFSPVLDGFTVSNEFILGAETGDYIFRAKDIATGVTFERVATVGAMPSPPIQVSGQISVPGYSPPNSFLANRIVFAEAENLDGAYLAVTDNMGMYTFEMDASATDSTFWASSSNIPGFVAPEADFFLASGTVSNVDFTYLIPTDSLYGFVKDDLGAVINITSRVNAWQQGGGERESLTSDGRYVFYFSDADSGTGDWYVSTDDGTYGTSYMSAGEFQFTRDTITNFQHDFIVYRTDAEIYARVTEEGGPPSSQYIIETYSMSLNTWTSGLSGTGADNIVTLHVTSQDPSGWFVGFNTWNEDFPIPLQYTNIGFSENVSPGDTVTLNLSSSFGCCFGDRGNANGDPEDKINVTDITYLVQYLFGVPNGPAPTCTEEANTNGDPEEKLNVTDITFLVQYLFGVPNGPAPPACP